LISVENELERFEAKLKVKIGQTTAI
jgi:hypothetical protein